MWTQDWSPAPDGESEMTKDRRNYDTINIITDVF